MILSALRWIGRACLALFALVVTYAAAGFTGGAIATNDSWRPPEQGVRIYVESNGVHTGLVLPLRAAGVDFRDLLKPGDLRDPATAAFSHIAVGWGDRSFYVSTPSWADVRPGTVLRAAIGSHDTVVHVEHVPEPRVEPERRSILLRPDEYRRLAAYVRATFARARGAPAPIHGYFRNDAFYAGIGTYSALNTCNAWTGSALRNAGVRMGIWTPFPNTVMQWI
jgi:uncharacterized protein (TIGR02117 family)